MKLSEYKEPVYQVIGAAMVVHGKLGRALLEPIYQEALALMLQMRGYASQREVELKIYFMGIELQKRYKMDMVVENVIVELKSVSRLLPAHRAQLCNYLRLTQKPIGLLINFGEHRLIAERWVYDREADECYLVDKSLNRVPKEQSFGLLNEEFQK